MRIIRQLASLWHKLHHALMIAFCLSVVFISVQPAAATTLPANFSESVLAQGFNQPTAMAFAPDGRLFVLEQGGTARVIQNGQVQPAPFVSLSVNSSGERGLLGLAFDPNFASNGYLYLYYTTASAPIHNRISRFTANGSVAVPGSEVIIMDLENLSGATNHNGGAMHFGTDGKLYVAVGENANTSYAQSLQNRLGKMLRINPDGSIPTDNPFYTQTTGANRAIWSYGLRNPFTFAFQPGSTRMFINDVGAGTWEEINNGGAGANYGWPQTEGETTDTRYVSPLFAYPHGGSSTSGCAITGGVFYSAPTIQFPSAWAGDYFFADYCSNWIRRYDPESDSAFDFVTATWNAPVDLDVGSDGTLYYLARGGRAGEGRVLSIRYSSITTNTPAPAPTRTPTPTVTATLLPTYSPTMTASPTILPSITPSTTATLPPTNTPTPPPTVTAIPQAPTPAITTPAVGARYNAGDTLTYSGSANDAEDGALPPSALEWEIVFHHDVHTHPFMPATRGASGSIFIPTEGETAANVWYRVYLRAFDSAGMMTETYVDVYPNIATLTIQTEPTGLQVKLEGQPAAAPLTVNSVVGTLRALDTDVVQTLNGVQYRFSHWSDGGAQAHTLSSPATNTTYTAVFIPNVTQTPLPSPTPLPTNATTVGARAAASALQVNAGDALTLDIIIDNTHVLAGGGMLALEAQCRVTPLGLLVGGQVVSGALFGPDPVIINPGFRADGSVLYAAAQSQQNPAVTASGLAFSLNLTALTPGTAVVECIVEVIDATGESIVLPFVGATIVVGQPPSTATSTSAPTATLMPTNAPPPTPTAVPSPTPTLAPQMGSISGVVDRSHSDGAGILITLYDAQGTAVASATSDGEGHFALDQVLAGSYQIAAMTEGYLPAVGSLTVVNGQVVEMPQVTLVAGDVYVGEPIVIDELDVVQFIISYGQRVPPAPAASDFNRDGRINLRDLYALATHLRTAGPTVWQ